MWICLVELVYCGVAPHITRQTIRISYLGWGSRHVVFPISAEMLITTFFLRERVQNAKFLKSNLLKNKKNSKQGVQYDLPFTARPFSFSGCLMYLVHILRYGTHHPNFKRYTTLHGSMRQLHSFINKALQNGRNRSSCCSPSTAPILYGGSTWYCCSQKNNLIDSR